MPNKCTKCGKLHPETANYLLKGCDVCGSKFFFYVRAEHLKEMEKDFELLSTADIKEMEQDVREIVASTQPEAAPEIKDDTVILDVEAVRVLQPGKYVIDVTNLFAQKPIVIRVGSGRYELDLSTMMKWRRAKRK